jgi:predicted DNA binding CopG/RHH family protein
MKRLKLDKEEKEMLKAFEASGFQPARNSKELMRQAVIMAKNTSKMLKDTSITIRISSDVLNTIKSKASKQGVPYQTLIGSLIYQYADNRIKLNLA